jgi:hypothetical protein
MAQDPRRFIFSSDHKIPCFVWKKEGTVVNSGGTILGGCVKFAHNLAFVPLLVGYWSLNGDFSNSHDISSGRMGNENKGFAAFADSTYIYINASVLDNTPTTFFYRLFAYCPPDYYGDVTPITDESKFHFSTDYEYLKIAFEDKIVPGSARKVEFQHNLGYIPLYKIWRTNNYDFWENGATTKKGLGPTASYVDYTSDYIMQNVADSNKLTVTWQEYQPDGSDYAYYQIYSNEA